MNKRGLSLFLALALCLTLLPAAAFASGEPETSTPHTHYLCGNGEACSYVGGHNETDKTTFATAIRQDNNGYVWVGNGTQEQPNQCVLSEGTYYLASDLVLKGPPIAQFGCIQIDGNVALCLNGHTITIIDDRDAFDIRRSLEGNPPTLTLTDCKSSGKITHGASNGTKYLGNGVSLHKSCNFIMYGGSITGNNASSFGSGGMCVYGTMTVSGSVRITDNVNGGSKGDNGIYTGGTASNVRLVGRTTITIDGPLTEGSQIGVSLYSNRIFTSGWSKNMSDKPFSSYFTADDSSSTVALENGELKLSNPHTHTWTYTASGTTITATCKNCAENNNTDFHGGSVTIAAPEAGTPTYDGRPKAAAVTVSDDWPGANANSIRITYKCGETTLSAAPTDAGTYTAGITVGEGEGAVTASVEYTIAPKELADPTIEIASGSVYDGNAKTPNVTVKVELPKNAGETKVEIPVSNVKPGTVAVLVHPDGTEEIVKNSLPTADGIQLTINGSATVKIMDNSKDFIDTRNHWAKDAIDFVSARGLVNGMSDTIYAPNNSTTRAQLWTILARQNDADLTGGSTWYEKAQNWAKAKSISDGANPNGIINRAQMVTMLWRTMGQPAAGSTANFTDVPADAYYADAVSWAVENGITTGVGNGKFDPDAACTRGQIATFLYRYMK